jgi:MFS transporter, Spinster family, sphingosine-1-phosphate transporter
MSSSIEAPPEPATEAAPAPNAAAPEGTSPGEALALLVALAFLNYADRNLLLPALAPIGRELTLSDAQLGLLSSGFHLVYAITAPLVGYLADRLPRKRIILLVLCAWSVVTASSGLAWGFASLLILRALTGLGEGGYFPAAVSLIGDLFAPAARGRAIAIHGAAATLGGSAGLAAGGVLASRIGWRATFLAAIVPGLVLAAVFHARFREPPRGALAALEPSPRGPTGTRRAYLRIVLSMPVLLISLAACAAALSMQGVNTFMVKFFEEQRGVSAELAALLTSLGFAFSLVGQLSGGWASDSLTRRSRGARPLLAGAAYLLAAPMLLALALVDSVPLDVACYAASQIGRGFAEPSLYGTIIDALPAEERGTAQGFLLLCTFGGATAGSWVAGLLSDGFGLDRAIASLSLFSAISGALALVLSGHLRRREAPRAFRAPLPR